MSVRTIAGMATRERVGDVAAGRARRTALDIGREIHEARLSHGISLAAAARAAGMSRAQAGRIERGDIRWPTLEQLTRAALAVGLDLSLKAYPGARPVRDAPSLALLGRFEALLGMPLRLRREVGLPKEGDQRAWDGMIVGGDSTAFTEAEARLSDLQALMRRIALKLRDDPRGNVVLLVINDTAHNRRVLAELREALRADFPLDGAEIARDLRRGRIPRASGIILR